MTYIFDHYQLAHSFCDQFDSYIDLILDFN